MTRLIRKEINEYRSRRWNSFLTTIGEKYGKDNTTFWKYLSRIYKPSPLPFNKLAVGNKRLTVPKDIAEELYKYYNILFSPPNEDPADPHDTKINQEFNKIQTLVALCRNNIKPTNILEIKRLIKELKPKKSAGVDNISNFIIKTLPPAYLESLCSCFNEWLKEGKFPDDWKTAK